MIEGVYSMLEKLLQATTITLLLHLLLAISSLTPQTTSASSVGKIPTSTASFVR